MVTWTQRLKKRSSYDKRNRTAKQLMNARIKPEGLRNKNPVHWKRIKKHAAYICDVENCQRPSDWFLIGYHVRKKRSVWQNKKTDKIIFIKI